MSPYRQEPTIIVRRTYNFAAPAYTALIVVMLGFIFGLIAIAHHYPAHPVSCHDCVESEVTP